jgi:hypothetical protein
MEQLQTIKSKIYEIRGQKVVLDFNLAEMYQVETRTLNQAVKRNIDRFPDNFMFQLTDDEVQNWKSQFVISNSINMGLTKQEWEILISQFATSSWGGTRKLPYTFTEQSVAMLKYVSLYRKKAYLCEAKFITNYCLICDRI